MKKLICLLLLVALSLCAVACSGGGKETPKETSPLGEQDTVVTSPIDTVPKKDFDNNDFTILVRTEFAYEFDQTETSGDRLNAAVIKRNSLVQERYNLNLQIISEPGNWQNRDNFKTKVNTAVSFDPCPYDLIVGAQNQLCAYITEGAFTDLMPIETLNSFESDWWFDGFVDNVSFKDKLYFVVGDVGVTLLENCNAVAFNKDTCTSYGLEYPYDLVKEKQWTLEAMIEMTEAVGYDLGADNKADATDRFALICGGSALRGFSTSFVMPITSLNEDGVPYISLADSQYHAVDIFDTFRDELIAADDRCFISDTENIVGMFSQGKSLFMLGNLSSMSTVRQQSEADFGILPYPMYDTAQGAYYTHVYETLSVFSIPVTARSYEDSGLILEALGAASYSYVTPEYFELVLKGQNARDIESYEMVEMIRENITFNFGFVHATALATSEKGDNGPNGFFNQMAKKDFNFTYSFDQKAGGWREKLSELYDKYASME